MGLLTLGSNPVPIALAESFAAFAVKDFDRQVSQSAQSGRVFYHPIFFRSSVMWAT
jgi:hypothetical protein